MLIRSWRMSIIIYNSTGFFCGYAWAGYIAQSIIETPQLFLTEGRCKRLLFCVRSVPYGTHRTTQNTSNNPQ